MFAGKKQFLEAVPDLRLVTLTETACEHHLDLSGVRFLYQV